MFYIIVASLRSTAQSSRYIEPENGALGIRPRLGEDDMTQPNSERADASSHGSVAETGGAAAPVVPARHDAAGTVAHDPNPALADAQGQGESPQAAAHFTRPDANERVSVNSVPPTARAPSRCDSPSSATAAESPITPGESLVLSAAVEPTESLGGTEPPANEVDSIARFSILANAQGRASAQRLAQAEARLARDNEARDVAMAAMMARLDSLEAENRRLRDDATAARATRDAEHRRANELSELARAADERARAAVAMADATLESNDDYDDDDNDDDDDDEDDDDDDDGYDEQTPNVTPPTGAHAAPATGPPQPALQRGTPPNAASRLPAPAAAEPAVAAANAAFAAAAMAAPATAIATAMAPHFSGCVHQPSDMQQMQLAPAPTTAATGTLANDPRASMLARCDSPQMPQMPEAPQHSYITQHSHPYSRAPSPNTVPFQPPPTSPYPQPPHSPYAAPPAGAMWLEQPVWDEPSTGATWARHMTPGRPALARHDNRYLWLDGARMDAEARCEH